MSEGLGLLDRIVDLVARAMDAAGLPGTRLRWRWNQRRRAMGESGLRALMFWRSARSTHKMCPQCRALVPRNARSCPQCGARLAGVAAPGFGRLLANLFPGAAAATSLILLVNGLMLLLMMLAPGKESAGGLQGLVAFDGATLVRFGSGWSPFTFGYGQWWRLVTPIFLHGGLLHFAFNSYVLLQLGPLVEHEYGPERFWVVYLLSGIAGNVLSQSLRVVHTVGASGAIFGLIGLLLVYGVRRGGVAGRTLRSVMGRWAVYMLIFSILPGIDLLAHVGGFLGGLVLGAVVPAGTLRSRRAAAAWQVAALGSVVLVLYCFYQVSRVTG